MTPERRESPRGCHTHLATRRISLPSMRCCALALLIMIGCQCESAGIGPGACGVATALAQTPSVVVSRSSPSTGLYLGGAWQQRGAHSAIVWPHLRGASPGDGLVCRMRGGETPCDAHPDLEDACAVAASVQRDQDLAATDPTRPESELGPDNPVGGMPERGLEDIGTADWGGADSDIEEIDTEAQDAYKGCRYEEIKVKPRVRPDRRPQAETVQLWDCVVTTDDGTVVDCESPWSSATSDYKTGGYITLHLPAHGVALQLPRGSLGGFRFRCSSQAPVLQASAQGRWSTVEAEGLDGFEFPSALAVLQEEAEMRTRKLATSVRWQREGGVERLRAGKWCLERVWPGSNVCILNLDTGDLQIWLTPRGFYFFGVECEDRAATGLFEGACFEVTAVVENEDEVEEEEEQQQQWEKKGTSCRDKPECTPQHDQGRAGGVAQGGAKTGRLHGGAAPRARDSLEARQELQVWVLKGAIAFEGEALDVPPKGALPARPRTHTQATAFRGLRGGSSCCSEGMCQYRDAVWRRGRAGRLAGILWERKMSAALPRGAALAVGTPLLLNVLPPQGLRGEAEDCDAFGAVAHVTVRGWEAERAVRGWQMERAGILRMRGGSGGVRVGKETDRAVMLGSGGKGTSAAAPAPGQQRDIFEAAWKVLLR